MGKQHNIQSRISGAYVIEINIEETPNSYLVDETPVGRASEIVPLLLRNT